MTFQISKVEICKINLYVNFKRMKPLIMISTRYYVHIKYQSMQHLFVKSIADQTGERVLLTENKYRCNWSSRNFLIILIFVYSTNSFEFTKLIGIQQIHSKLTIHKISRCMSNMARKISGHNNKIINNNKNVTPASKWHRSWYHQFNICLLPWHES